MQDITYSRQWFRRWPRRLAQHYHRFIHQYIKNRSLRQAERFVLGWMAVFILISGLTMATANRIDGHYLAYVPDDGGRYTEGMVGELEAINPIFAGNQVSRAAEALVFNGLFRRNGQEEMVPDLAREYEVSDNGTRYRVTLRDDIRWHDGVPVTSEDVVFTFQTIADSRTGSTLQTRWEDIDMKVISDTEVEFELPNAYTPFLQELTTGIVPEHELSGIDPERLRAAGFNNNPIGTGPFEFVNITGTEGQGKVRLRANPEYHGGRPRLDAISLALYEGQEQMIAAYNRGEINSMLVSSDFDSDAIDERASTQIDTIDSTLQVFAFFNTERLENRRLRTALKDSVDVRRLEWELDSGQVSTHSPLLPEHAGHVPVQGEVDTERARELLQEEGWQQTDDGSWEQDEEPLGLDLVTLERGHYQRAAQSLQDQWQELGLEVDVTHYDGAQLQQERIQPRDFDVLVFGIEHTSDPDVYAYWHSSQTEAGGQNVSQYVSETADINLEDGRTRNDSQLRAAKYRSFQETWAEDVPAIALYRMQHQYVHREPVAGVRVDDIMHASNRFHNVADWTVSRRPVLQRLTE